MGDLSRFYTCSYLTSEPAQNYLRRPLEPYPPKSPQFSRPASSAKSTDHRSRSSSRSMPRHAIRGRSLPRAGMQAMVDSLRSSTPRSKSPCMLNEEPIELSHYPSGQKPKPNEVPKIERDDFPAPPFPYAEDRLKKVEKLHNEPNGSNDPQQDSTGGEEESEDPHLKKEEEELSKIASGIGKIFLKTVQEREKFRKWKRANIDPRNASRTPSAKSEPHSRLRYVNPTNASPSRDLDRAKPWDESEHDYDYSSEQATRSGTQIKPNSQLSSPDTYKIISSLRSTPRPGYGIKSDLGYYEKNRSNQALNNMFHRDTPLEFYENGGEGLGAFYNPYLRRSLPNVNQNYHHIVQEGPLKLYPYHVLMTCNFRLPPDVDRCHLERHLSDEEFQYLFRCDRLDFYRMPEWKRNELKRRIKLF